MGTVGGTAWRSFVGAAAALGLACAVPLSPGSAEAAAFVAPAKPRPAMSGSVYLFRGLANVFSTGLDTLAGELRAWGVPANVLNHLGWAAVADEIEVRYRRRTGALPIIIIGHSFGGDAAISISRALAGRGIPVDLVVVFDATVRRPVPPNVRHIVNFYHGGGIGKRLTPAEGFRGVFRNINVDQINAGIDHFSIEKVEAFHRRVIAEVLQVYGFQPAGNPAGSGLPGGQPQPPLR